MYEKVSTDLKFVEREKQVEKFWKDKDIFRKSMKMIVTEHLHQNYFLNSSNGVVRLLRKAVRQHLML